MLFEEIIYFPSQTRMLKVYFITEYLVQQT